MMAMAAIVAQNGATGQSLVEQFTTGGMFWFPSFFIWN